MTERQRGQKGKMEQRSHTPHVHSGLRTLSISAISSPTTTTTTTITPSENMSMPGLLNDKKATRAKERRSNDRTLHVHSGLQNASSSMSALASSHMTTTTVVTPGHPTTTGTLCDTSRDAPGHPALSATTTGTLCDTSRDAPSHPALSATTTATLCDKSRNGRAEIS